MNPKTHKKIEKINNRLQEFLQNTRIIDASTNSLTLDSGAVLTGADARKFYRRITGKTLEWVKNVDNLLSGTITEKDIKSKVASIGGFAVQMKYGKDISRRLNNGIPWNVGSKGQRIGTLGPRTEEVKAKISKKNSGSGNGMFGVKMSEADKQQRSHIMKQKILSGEFTPNSNNRNTHWNSYFDGKKYRSSWEALYQYSNKLAEYEKLRIEYEFEGISRIYIVDFVDHTQKIVVEVKPAELCSGLKYFAKKESLDKWASANGYTVIIATEEWLRCNIVVTDYSKFDERTVFKIKALYEIN